MKPGAQTTEFWITFFVNVVSAIVAVGLVPDDSPITKIAALVLMLAATYGYNQGRVDLKIKDMQTSQKSMI